MMDYLKEKIKTFIGRILLNLMATVIDWNISERKNPNRNKRAINKRRAKQICNKCKKKGHISKECKEKIKKILIGKTTKKNGTSLQKIYETTRDNTMIFN